MAHFSTILLFEKVRGLEQRIAFATALEQRYCSRRGVDSERAMVRVDGSRKGDTTVTYDKGAWVFWMLMQHMGREEMLSGLQSFIAHYLDDRDHPVLQDLAAHLRPFAPDPVAYDEFVDQWFFDVVLPEFTLGRAVRQRAAGANGAWDVEVIVRNAGTGRLPVEVAAQRGKRFAIADDPGEVFREVRTVVELGAKESTRVHLECPFEPERIVVDPDATVLQRGRARAIHRF